MCHRHQRPVFFWNAESSGENKLRSCQFKSQQLHQKKLMVHESLRGSQSRTFRRNKGWQTACEKDCPATSRQALRINLISCEKICEAWKQNKVNESFLRLFFHACPRICSAPSQQVHRILDKPGSNPALKLMEVASCALQGAQILCALNAGYDVPLGTPKAQRTPIGQATRTGA